MKHIFRKIGEPSMNDNEFYVVASGSQGWKNVTGDWTEVVNNRQQPAGFVCERGTSCSFRVFLCYQALQIEYVNITLQ